MKLALRYWDTMPQLRKLLKLQTELVFTCSKSTIETLEKGVKYVQI